MIILSALLRPVTPVQAQTPSAAGGPGKQNPVPLMAYYYIWFNEQSWNRAKIDYPVLGRYSSDDTDIMEQHIQWAKDAGIQGFIVSWKSTYQLDQRLEKLIAVAEKNDFHLWIIYQGLDFNRNPLPVDQVDADFEYFIQHYAGSPVFSMYDRPVIIWSGTWMFSPAQIESVTKTYGDHLLILASERNVEGFQRMANFVDGNAYYWSSVNPDTYPGYQEKLDSMSEAVHQAGGLWVAPAAPGFDARLVGGTTVVERKDGETFRREMDVALRSSPDVIGIISWNEFSENSHIEPSLKYAAQSLDTLADIQNGIAPVIQDFDSNAPASTNNSDSYPIMIILATIIFISSSILMVILRPLRARV